MADEAELLTLPEAITSIVKCDICGPTDEELKQLDCKHWACSTCLEDLFMMERNEQKHGGEVKCTICQAVLTRQPEDYTSSKVRSHVRNFVKNLEVAKREGKDEDCEHKNCFQKASLLCGSCRKFICSECKGRTCFTNEDTHEVKAIADCENDIYENFALWQTGKKRIISELKVQRQAIRAADGAHELRVLNEKISEEESALNFAMETASQVKGIPLLRLLNALIVYEERRQVDLGASEWLFEGIKCFDVCETSSGDLLVARKGGVQVYNLAERCQRKFLPYSQYVSSVESYKDIVVLGTYNSDTQKMMVTLDASYEELRSWEIPEETQDFTVVNDTVFLSLAAEDVGLKAYDLHSGERKPQADLEWKGVTVGITSIAPSSIVFTDRIQHKIYKQCLASGQRQFKWAYQVPAPHCICVDDNGLIWVRSNRNDNLTILDRDGTPHQDPIINEALTSFENINGICVHANWLYVACKSGLARFPINYVQQ